MITKNHKKSLSPDQELAIASLMSGATDQEAAKAAGVSRETVNRWRNHDPFFQAELNRRQREIWESNKMRLQSFIRDALGTISRAVKDNPTIAMKILEKCQGFDVIQPPTGPTDVESILRELALKRAEEELAATREEESKGQLVFTDPIADLQELSPLIKKHLFALRKEYGVK